MRIKLAALLFVAIPFITLAGCAPKQSMYNNMAHYTYLYNIPGITPEEIKAVEDIRSKYDHFIYGVMPSTEAFYDENGEIRGFAASFCGWLTVLFGIKFVPELHEARDIYPTLRVDFTGDLTATPERETELGFLFTSAIAERSTKYLRIAGSLPRSEILKTRPLRLVFVDGSTTAAAAMSKLAESSVPFEPFYINDYDTAYRMMKSGEVDAFIHESVTEAAFDKMGDVVAEDFLPLIYEPVSLTAQNPELEPIITIVQKALEHGGTNYLSDMYEKTMKEYAQYKLFLQFDERELAYLRENTAVAYLAEFDNYPLSFFNTNENQWQGIAVDILDEISALTGLTFAPIHEPGITFHELAAMLENGQGAMISEMIRTNEREGRFIWPQRETLKDHYVAISQDTLPNISVHRIMKLKVGVQTGTAYADLFYTWFPDHPHVIEYDDANAAFKGLEDGDVDILMYGMQHLLTITNYHERPGFKANMIFDYTFGSLFGFNKDEAILCSIVNKAMGVIDTEMISAQWMRKTFDYRSKIIQSQRPWLIGVIVLFLIIIILTFVLYLRSRNAGKHLDMLVQQRTAELEISRRDLSAALRDAKTANRAKTAFLATMSHEIRTPMNAIIGITQIQLQKNNLSGEYAEALEKIYNSGNNLLGIINDILDLSKIETGKLKFHPAEYHTPSLINDTVQLNIVRIGAKRIKFILEVSEHLPSRLWGDELRLKQILNNLLSNSIKYTESGFVKLSVDHYVSGEDIALRFIVEDSGQGMKPEDLEKLFSEYARFNTETNRNVEGAGLGLTITKKIVEMMDGKINVDSEYGKGSTFTVTVRQTAVECGAIGAELAEKLRNFAFTSESHRAQLQFARSPMPYGKVLVVDDVDTNVYVAEGLLRPYELNVETASSGFEAINRIQSGKVYDVIFMDHMMPQMDGMETTKKLRAMGYTGVIVALTANALAGNEKKFAKKGFDGFISKPIDLLELNSVLNNFVRDKYPEEAEKYAPVSAEPASDRLTETDSKLLQVFCRDAQKAIAALRDTAASGDIRLFTTTAHAMKSALANVGETEASADALTLETAGRNGDMAVIAAQTGRFIETLEALVKKLTPALAAAYDDADMRENTALLAEQLRIVQAACEGYDDAAAYAALDSLREMPWKAHTSAELEKVRDMLFLDSDFEGAAEQVRELLTHTGSP